MTEKDKFFCWEDSFIGHLWKVFFFFFLSFAFFFFEKTMTYLIESIEWIG